LWSEYKIRRVYFSSCLLSNVFSFAAH